MNVIITYLETMFSAYPQTPRLLEAKAELRGMMEDAYAGLIAEGRSENEAVGQVIRDFGNLDEVAPVLGITADIAPAGSASPPAPQPAAAGAPGSAPHSAPSPERPPVSLTEAQGYAAAVERSRFRIAVSIMLFVISPAAIVVLPTAADAGALPIGSGAGTFLGLLILLVLVAVGVMLQISASRETAPYRRITEGRSSITTEVALWAESLVNEHEGRMLRALQLAVALWILAPIPLIAFALLLRDSPGAEVWVVVGVAILLAVVASGLGILLPQTWARRAAGQFDREPGSATGDEDEDETGIVGVVAAVYWPLLFAVYLAWSFIGNAWGTSWIIWPIGGVLFGAIAAGGGAVERYRRARR